MIFNDRPTNCSVTIAQRILWSTLLEIYNNGHILIKIELLSSKTTPNTKLPKMDIKEFQREFVRSMDRIQCKYKSHPPLKGPIEHDVIHIIESITTVANISIGKTKVTLNILYTIPITLGIHTSKI